MNECFLFKHVKLRQEKFKTLPETLPMANGRLTTKPAVRALHSKYSTNSSINNPMDQKAQKAIKHTAVLTRRITQRHGPTGGAPIAQFLGTLWKKQLLSGGILLFRVLSPFTLSSLMLFSNYKCHKIKSTVLQKINGKQISTGN